MYRVHRSEAFYQSMDFNSRLHVQAYARRAAAWACLQEFYHAAEDYKRALVFEPKNQDCLTELEQCLVHLEMDYRSKLNTQPHNEKLKRSLHDVREDLKKIGKCVSAVLMSLASRIEVPRLKPNNPPPMMTPTKTPKSSVNANASAKKTS